ncbi:thiosulfate oxidation carrier protein SoxY [Limnohabitans sp.]|uniref:thiosulfate oxidation carrier protein SoxY n=1 Tax=Limnohabitans sp. TaxID=1907725 RepID=UPI00286EF37E|nr:thiosulfate oxidation carrier protein SoxY [Limnohabitans sp.]
MWHSKISSTRRSCLAHLSLGAVGISSGSNAWSAPELHSQADLLSRGLEANGIEVTLPPLADNSNAIPLQFTLQAPAGKALIGFEIIAPENPNRVILRMKLGQAQPSFTFNTRIRLAMTQDVWILAHLNNGSSLGRPTHTVVTATACFDET